jgi:hypothetical protein
MTFDEQHGWVERGTHGVHSGAVVRDLTTEMHTLHKMHLRAAQDGYWWPEMPRAMRAERLEELIRHHENMSEMLRAALRQSPVKRTAEEYITHKLALLAPYIAILRAGDEKRRRRVYAGFDVGQGSTTAMTTYAVEGDTLRIVHAAMLPVRAQTVNVTMTIGGE